MCACAVLALPLFLTLAVPARVYACAVLSLPLCLTLSIPVHMYACVVLALLLCLTLCMLSSLPEHSVPLSHALAS